MFVDLATELLPLVRDGSGPALVGIGGGVAVGKSTLASALATAAEHDAAVVSLDSFLHPNAVLEQRGAAARKGWPDTYDLAAVDEFLTGIRSGPVEIPVYSHEIYDIVPNRTRRVEPAPLIAVEGLHAVNPAVRAGLDRTVYLHAESDLLRAWFVARFHELVAAARQGSGGFYAVFADMDDATVTSVAEGTWDAINGPNVETNVVPTRHDADIVVTLGPGREVVALDVR